MTKITIAAVADGFAVTSGATPPLILNTETTLAFATALASPDLAVAAWKQDKLVWAPATREPIGVWVSEAGQPSVWIAGQSEDITLEDARALAEEIILSTAEHKAGDEIISTRSFSGDKGSISVGTIGKVAGVKLDGTSLFYDLDFDDRGIANNCVPSGFEAAPPVGDWSVVQDGRCYPYRTTTVSARTRDHAISEARKVFDAMPSQQGWTREQVEIDGIDLDSVDRIEGTPEDQAAKEGWVYGPDNTILAYKDASNVSIFGGDNAAATRFVMEKAFAGSRRHQQALLR